MAKAGTLIVFAPFKLPSLLFSSPWPRIAPWNGESLPFFIQGDEWTSSCGFIFFFNWYKALNYTCFIYLFIYFPELCVCVTLGLVSCLLVKNLTSLHIPVFSWGWCLNTAVPVALLFPLKTWRKAWSRERPESNCFDKLPTLWLCWHGGIWISASLRNTRN